MLSKLSFFFILGTLLVSKCSKTLNNNNEKNTGQVIWSDEFDYTGPPNSDLWSYELGDGCPKLCGWGNNELEYYTDKKENARVENGHLIIEAHKEKINGQPYSSGKLISKNKGDWTYGKIEIRAKLPTGKGTWPAIWMMPSNNNYGGWPKSGEIDIMEHVGYERDSIFGTVHTEAFNHIIGTQKAGQIFVPDAEENFHIYTINWTAEKIEWYIDNVLYHSFVNENKTSAEWPFSQPFYLILNLAVGGNWGGKEGVDENIWPQRMEIDYVRVYQI